MIVYRFLDIKNILTEKTVDFSNKEEKRRISYSDVAKAITIISKGTLLILGLHIPKLHLLEMIFPSYTYEILTVFVLLISYYPIQWFDRWCPELLGRIMCNI